MTGIFDDAKRIKVFEKFLVALGNGKIILKDLEKPNEHQTIKIRSDGIVDLHFTKEGSKKEYESQAKVSLVDGVKDLLTKPEILMNAVQDLVAGFREVNFDEDEFEHLKVAPMKTKEEFASLAVRKKRDVTFPIENVSEFLLNDIVIPWKSAKGKIHGYGMVFDQEIPVPIGFIYEIDGKFLYISIELMEKSSVVELVRKMTLQDQIDSQRKEKPL